MAKVVRVYMANGQSRMPYNYPLVQREDGKIFLEEEDSPGKWVSPGVEFGSWISGSKGTGCFHPRMYVALIQKDPDEWAYEKKPISEE